MTAEGTGRGRNKLDVIIHRGAAQIGGCCTEIRTRTTRIFIDLGQELVKPGDTPRPLAIDGLTRGEPRCDGVFFTHYHGDHIGLYGDVLPGIPLYMGEAAKEIFETLQRRLSAVDEDVRANLPRLEAIRTFGANKTIRIGDIRITPYFTDHSAYDAYMFLMEAEGKRILHTGDYRMHGYLGKGVLPMLKTYVGQVDLLITEGTTLSRHDGSPETEQELKRQLSDYVRQYKRVFVLCSSTNIDRLAGLHAVARAAHRPFICDGYQKAVLDVVSRRGGPKSGLYNFDHVLTYGDNLIPLMEEKGFCMPIRANRRFRAILDRFYDEDTLLLYSMWKGYLDRETAISQLLAGRNWKYLHTTGHAAKDHIRAVCAAVKPRLGVVPIHTEAPRSFDEICAPYPVIHPSDGEGVSL